VTYTKASDLAAVAQLEIGNEKGRERERKTI